MSLVDISHLGNLKSAEPIDLDMYPAASAGSFQLPKAGRYTVRAPEAFTAASFSESKASNSLVAQVDPTIVDTGFTVRFTKVSAKTWVDKKSGKEVSQLGQYLKSCGLQGEIPGDPQSQADAVASTANMVYEVYLDWRLFHRSADGTTLVIEGMKNFPSDGQGGYTPYVNDPSGELNDRGETKRLRANVVVTRFLAPRG